MDKTLICITTCNRISAIRAIVWEYIEFCKKNDDFDFLISLDGDDANTIAFCQEHNIPLLYSLEREGVGLSKNRVLEAYPEYAYYFFIEDDVMLLNPEIFQIHIDVCRESHIPHFSLFDKSRIIDQQESSVFGEVTVLHAWYGGAPFNFFSRAGLDKVGGFDVLFAKIKRFGHTEHSYRFVNAGLCKYPFNIIEKCMEGYVKWTEPGSVTRVKVTTTHNRLYEIEEDLIAKKHTWHPITTISEYRKPESLELEVVKNSKSRGLYRTRYLASVKVLDFLRLVKRTLVNIGMP